MDTCWLCLPPSHFLFSDSKLLLLPLLNEAVHHPTPGGYMSSVSWTLWLVQKCPGDQWEPEFLCRMDAGGEHLSGAMSCKDDVSLELPGTMEWGRWSAREWSKPCWPMGVWKGLDDSIWASRSSYAWSYSTAWLSHLFKVISFLFFLLPLAVETILI